MPSAICFNLDQSRILSSGNGLRRTIVPNPSINIDIKVCTNPSGCPAGKMNAQKTKCHSDDYVWLTASRLDNKSALFVEHKKINLLSNPSLSLLFHW